MSIALFAFYGNDDVLFAVRESEVFDVDGDFSARKIFFIRKRAESYRFISEFNGFHRSVIGYTRKRNKPVRILV